MEFTVLSIFETPIFTCDLPDRAADDRQLAAALRAEADDSSGLRVSNRGGWHSIPDLARRDNPELRKLCQVIVDKMRAATEMVAAHRGIEPPAFGLALTAWAMVMRRGDYTVPHDHPEATWSSVYVVDPGEPDLGAGMPPDDAGVLTLLDPRGTGAAVLGLNLFPSTFHLPPAQGRLVIFPGTLKHWVPPHRGVGRRVTIAANGSVRLAR
ncbi:MAG: hypothetical protein ACI9MR_001372 [Myxococcota bacterium]|jgi:uncharacterized protein (TIGR02466 family)